MSQINIQNKGFGNRMDEKLLIENILTGDQNEFRHLIERYQRLVFHIVNRMINNRHDIEEIAQEVFIKIFQNLRSFRFQSKLSTWISKIAYHTALNFIEKKRLPLAEDFSPDNLLLQSLKSESATPEEYTESNDLSMHLQKQINILPPRYRVILTMYHLESMTYAEISEIMEMPEGTVKNYLFRARQLLKERLSLQYSSEDL